MQREETRAKKWPALVQPFEEASRVAVEHAEFADVTIENNPASDRLHRCRETEATIREIRAANEALRAN